MRASFILAFLFCVLEMSSPSPALALGDAGIIGTVMETEGAVIVTSPSGGAVQATVETPVHLNDKVATGSGGRAFVLFIDNTELTLSENTELAIDEYVFDPDDNTGNKGRYSILRGTFYYVSGLIAKKENPDVQVATPYGAIGIRGTEFWGGDIDDDYGILVADGAVDVTTKQGKIALDKGFGAGIKSGKPDAMKPKLWPTEKVERAKKTIFMKRMAEIKQHVVAFKDRQQALRARYKEFMKQRLEKGREGENREGGFRRMPEPGQGPLKGRLGNGEFHNKVLEKRGDVNKYQAPQGQMPQKDPIRKLR